MLTASDALPALALGWFQASRPPWSRRTQRRSRHDRFTSCAGERMTALFVALGLVVVMLVGLAVSVRILKQYERGVQFRLGRVKDGARGPGLIFIIPLVDRVHRVSLRIVTMPIQSQGIITQDNVCVDVSAVAYFRVDDAVRSVVAIENVAAAINQIAQTTLRAVVGRHTPRRDAVGDRQDQPEHPRDPRRADRGLGRQGHGRRAQGHPASREHAARDGPPGRGRAREAREDHRRRGRGARRRRARAAPPTS